MTRTRALAALALLALGACVYLPKISSTVESHALPARDDSRLSTAIARAGDTPRAFLIEASHQALTTRLDLIDAADQSIDLQYFIWQNDATGILVIKKILAAADRGVRVRALLDDVQLEGLVNRLHALNSHPNIEIRIFNPFSLRMRFRLWLFRLAEFAIDGVRLNHRMHNKLFVADNALAILGGRNIGDDYFGRSRKRNFIDTDILLSGGIVPELSAGFDTYWNSRWSVPIGAMADLTLIPDDLKRLRERIDRRLAEQPDLIALDRDRDFADTVELWASGAPLADATVVVDDPSVSWFRRPDEGAAELAAMALTAEREVLVVTPYLVPTANLLDIADTLVARGVKITAVTNSLATSDVAIAQAAYSKFRRRIVESGVELYEMRGDPAIARDEVAEDISLHSKFIIVDRATVFIGSTNLDPRSLYINTELGVVLESPALAEQLERTFYELTEPRNAWRVVKTEDGIRWQTPVETLTRTPAKTEWQRLRYQLMRLLPLASQL